MSDQSQARPWGLAEVLMAVAVAVPFWLWGRTPKSFEDLRKLAVNLLVLAAIGLISFTVWKAVVEELTIVEAFAVPKSLGEHGYTGTIVAQRLIDRVEHINSTSRTRVTRVPIGRESQYASFSNLQVPSSGLTVQTVISLLRKLIGHKDDRIGGEITISQAATGSSPAVYELFMRFNIARDTPNRLGRPTDSRHFVEVKSSSNIDKLIDLSAQAIVEHTNPAVLASYLYSIRQWRSLDLLLDQLVVSANKSIARQAQTLRGMRLIEQGRMEEALDCLKEAAETEPRSRFAIIKYGDGLVKANEPDKAIEQFETVRQLTDKPNALLAGSWAIALQRKNDFDGARRMLEETDKAARQDPRIHRIWGDLLRDQGDFDGAVAKYRSAVGLEPQFWPAYVGWGVALQRKGDPAGAIEKFGQAIGADERVPHPHCHIAEVLLDQNDIDGATKAYRKAMEMDPEFARTSLCLKEGLARKSGLANVTETSGTAMQ